MNLDHALNPIDMAKKFWPDVYFYKQQRMVIESVRDNEETYVVAAHEVGKDFVTGFICLWYFLTHHTCRIITTSVKDDHLRVLWGEIGRFIDTCRYELRADKGGILLCNHRDIRKVIDRKTGAICNISYLQGLVSKTGEGMAGHHADYTLFVADEASGIKDEVYRRASTWMDRALILGNPYPSGGNFFEKAVEAGDILAMDDDGPEDREAA